jgi:hypothetical protein
MDIPNTKSRVQYLQRIGQKKVTEGAIPIHSLGKVVAR